MTRKSWAAVATAIAITSVAACGSGKGGGASGDSVAVAVIIPLTGASATTASQVKNSTQLAAAAVNKAGGIDGRKVKLKFYDDQLTAEGATKAAQRAVTQDRVTAIVGGFGSGESLAIKEIAERSKVPFLTIASISPELTAGAKYTFRLAPRQSDYGDAVVNTGQKLGMKHPVLLTDTSTIGLALDKTMPPHAKKVGLKLDGGPVKFTFQSTDMSAAVGAVVKRHPDGVLMVGAAGGDNGLVLKTLLEQGLNVPVVGFAPIVSTDAFKSGGKAFAKSVGTYGVQDVDASAPDVKKFLAAYTAKYGSVDLSEHIAQAYDDMNVLMMSLKKSGGKGGADLSNALGTVKNYNGVSGKQGATITFTPTDHDGHHGDYLVPYKVVNGKIKVVKLG